MGPVDKPRDDGDLLWPSPEICRPPGRSPPTSYGETIAGQGIRFRAAG